MNKWKLEKLRCTFEIEFHRSKYRPSAVVEDRDGQQVLRALTNEELLGDFNTAKDAYFAALDEMATQEAG
jgi:hypothetical protein